MNSASASHFVWDVEAGRITCRRQREGVVYDDSIDHWENAVCRLLNLSDEQARSWIEASVATGGGDFHRMDSDRRIAALRAGARAVFKAQELAEPSVESVASLKVFGEPVDRIWVQGIRECSDVAVVGPSRLDHGVLVRTGEGASGLVTPAEYEETYFEGGTYGVGYGDYKEQMKWRMEKSARQVRQLEGVARWIGAPMTAGTRALDVGSGYGYFRHALAACGYAHEGLDVSRHAAAVARDEFGYATFTGTLEDYASQHAGERFDLVTLFDTIEHVADPLALLRAAASLLRPGGLVAVRTPNLPAVEFEVFGRYYHSLKMEHLHYFSARSLARSLELTGLVPQFLTTEAHLLNGVLGIAAVQAFARTLRGSDLFAVGQRVCTE